MAGLRVFVAVMLAPEVQSAVTALQERLRTRLPAGLAWCRPEALHFTLAFLGDIPRERVAAVGEACREAAAGRGPFFLSLGGLGSFPARGPARVLWLGASAGGEKLASLQAALAAALARRGFPLEDRPYLPHLTLARARPGRFVDGSAWAGTEQTLLPERQRVEGLTVLRSELRPEGARYQVLDRVGLTPQEG